MCSLDEQHHFPGSMMESYSLTQTLTHYLNQNMYLNQTIERFINTLNFEKYWSRSAQSRRNVMQDKYAI